MSGNSSPLRVAVARTLTYYVACPDYEPFEDINDDRLAEASQWVLFSVLFTALLIRVDVAKEDKDDQEKLGIILVVLTLVPVLYAVALTMSDLNQKFSEASEKFKEIKTKAKPLELELGSIYGRSSEAVGRSNEGPNATMETSVSGSTSSATSPDPANPMLVPGPPKPTGPSRRRSSIAILNKAPANAQTQQQVIQNVQAALRRSSQQMGVPASSSPPPASS